MSKYTRGVKFYVHGKAEVTVNFPEEKVRCINCTMLAKDECKRFKCILTGRQLYYVNEGIHEDCPLRFEVDENV